MWKNRAGYLLVVAVFITLVAFYEHRYTYLGLYTVLGLPLLSLILGLLAAHSLRVEYSLQSDVQEKGTEGRFQVAVRPVNRRFPSALFPLGVRMKVSCSPGLLPEKTKLTARQERRGVVLAEIPFAGVFRGAHAIGLEWCRCADVMGLFRFRLKLPPAQVVTVLPRTLNLVPMQLYGGDGAQDPLILGRREEDTAVVSDTRPYQPADPLRLVHWKLSARAGAMQSKNFQQVSSRAVAFVVDNSRIGPADTEQALRREDETLEAAISLMTLCVRQDCVLSLHYSGCPESVTRPGADFGEMYRSLAALPFDGQGFPAWLSGLSLPEGMDVVLFAQGLCEETALWAANQAVKGCVVSVYAFTGQGREYASNLEASGVSCAVFDDEVHFADIFAEG